MKRSIGKLTGTVKHYDWGGTEFIPSILGEKTGGDQPSAEYWLGVHPQADCKVIYEGEEPILLRELIARDPVAALGQPVYDRFGNIPYLLKALDVKDMLSIQVHPNKADAVVDFEREEAAGIPIGSPTRNYKDRNHKPELAVAMGDFWLLHGFRPEAQLTAILAEVPELNFLSATFKKGGYAAVYREVMMLPQEEVAEKLASLLTRILPLYRANQLEKASADYWAAKASITFSATDRGIFSIYLFNVVNMKKGQAIFQDAGIPHAYLEGWNVEIMASSDNVLRGGLTNKHVDVTELLKHVKCEATVPNILPGEADHGGRVYRTPAVDFELTGYELLSGASVELRPATAEIFLLVHGAATLTSGTETVELAVGAPSAVIFPGEKVILTGSAPETLLYKASVPSITKN